MGEVMAFVAMASPVFYVWNLVLHKICPEQSFEG